MCTTSRPFIRVSGCKASDTALDSTLLTSPVTYLAGKEFKRIDVHVRWTDATGAPRNIYLEDAISAINPADSAAVSKTTKGATPRKAQAIVTSRQRCGRDSDRYR